MLNRLQPVKPNTRKKQYDLTLNLSMHFRVRYRSLFTLKMKLFLTTVNSLHLLASVLHKELHLRCCIVLKLNIVKSLKILKGIEGHPPWLVQPRESLKNSLF